MSTLRVSNIEAKSDVSSPSVHEKIKVTNSEGDVLVHIDGATSGISTVGINTTVKTFDVDSNQNIDFVGNLTAPNITVTGTLSYDDVTNIDSVGIITARDGLQVTGGQVGINTTAPAEKLDVWGTIRASAGSSQYMHLYPVAGAGYFDVRNATSYPSIVFRQIGSGGIQERLRIDSAGSVGIGTDNPGAKTHIDSVTSNTPLVVEASQNNRSRIVFRNNVETGTECNIELFDDDLRFVTNSGERLRIDVNGNIGINDNNPDTQLSVNSGATNVVAKFASTDQYAWIQFRDNSTTDTAVMVGADGDNLLLRSGSNERVRVTSGGTVKFATNNSSTDYLEWGGNPRLMLQAPAGLNGLRVYGTTTPFEIGGSASTRKISMGGDPNYDLSISASYSLSSGEHDSSPKVFLNATRHNGSGTVTSFQTSIQAVSVSNTSNDGYLGLGASASPDDLVIRPSGNIGINCNDPGSMLELNAAAGTKMGISLGAVGDNITASRYIGICKSSDQTDLGANSGFQGIEFGGPNSANEGYLAFHTHDLGVESGERIRLTKDGKFGVGLTAPESKVQIRNTTTYGKDTYATANTGGSQTPPPGTFKWDNVTPVAGHGRGYEAYVQSGDAYPNASNYIDVLIRNAGFYRITLKRSHSSAEASVCQMMIYGLANSSNSNYPVVHMTGASGSGTSTATVQSGHGRGSSNAVASFYWEIHSYNVNTYDTIIRITTTGSNNQGIVALIEEI